MARQTFALFKRSMAQLREVASLGIAVSTAWRPRIRARYDGAHALNGAAKVAVFNHFDLRGRVADYVVYYLEALARAGFAIIFVTTSKKFPETSVARVRPHVARILHRVNIGYDFGAYRDGIAEVPSLEALEGLLVANDSVYGPVFDLGSTLEKMDDRADVWGLTDCWDTAWHLQSYFLYFRPSAINSEVFEKFWNNMILASAKSWVIRNYEVGLSRKCLNAGLRLDAVYPYREARQRFIDTYDRIKFSKVPGDENQERAQLDAISGLARSGAPLNPTHFFWNVLMFDMGLPFIKRDLLVSNHQGVPYLWRWRSMIKDFTNYDPALIDAHLRAVVKNRSA